MFGFLRRDKHATGSSTDSRRGAASQRTRRELQRAAAELDAIGHSQAIIRFAVDGTVLDANRNFLQVMGCRLEDVVGKHHRLFVEPALAASADYREFWASLAAGRFQSGIFKRVARTGRTVWLQASYNPILDEQGRTVGIIKVATDITPRKQREIETRNRSQAAIEFLPDGTILDANELFLQTMGYTLDEVRGKHHRMFVDAKHATSPQYAEFWRSIAKGSHHQGEFQRLRKGGEVVWLRGIYSPVLDDAGEVVGATKLATDITEEVRMREQSNEVGSSLGVGLCELSSSANLITDRVVRTAEIASLAQQRTTAATALLQQLLANTESIGEISDMIRDVADRTNLLALNAAVESARAGEAGRGFAVVADEVKNLAQQSRNATGEIASQLAQVSKQVAESVQAVAEICKEVEGVANNTSEVAAAVEEQSSVIQQLSATAASLGDRV